jgi:hypothetical protein
MKIDLLDSEDIYISRLESSHACDISRDTKSGGTPILVMGSGDNPIVVFISYEMDIINTFKDIVISSKSYTDINNFECSEYTDRSIPIYCPYCGDRVQVNEGDIIIKDKTKSLTPLMGYHSECVDDILDCIDKAKSDEIRKKVVSEAL